ncbi:hypothetical protein GS400_19650 [Pontibacillus sp. HMF3514]|nr:hypothetical protein GS400_19650 [Pontibacillus sp. HMF3514]
MELNMECIAIDQWLLEVMEHKRFTLEEQSREVNIDLPKRIKDVFMGREKIKRVMINLLDNALRHSKADTDIDIRITYEKHTVLIELEDRGEGISQEHQALIFDRTYRVETSRNPKYAGSGLGLAIAKHIV